MGIVERSLNGNLLSDSTEESLHGFSSVALPHILHPRDSEEITQASVQHGSVHLSVIGTVSTQGRKDCIHSCDSIYAQICGKALKHTARLTCFNIHHHFVKFVFKMQLGQD